MAYRLGEKRADLSSLRSGSFASFATIFITILVLVGLLGTCALLGMPQFAAADEISEPGERAKAAGTSPTQPLGQEQTPGEPAGNQQTPGRTGQAQPAQAPQAKSPQINSRDTPSTPSSGGGGCTVEAEPERWNWTITSETGRTAELEKFTPSLGWLPDGSEVQLPGTFTKDGNTYTVTSIGEQAMVYQPGSGNAIRHLCIPDSVETIKSQAFFGTHIDEIHLPSNLKTIGYQAFAYSDIPSIGIPDKVETIGESAFINDTNHPNRLSNLDLSQATSLTGIGNSAFRNTLLSSVTIPDRVKTIGENAFSNMATLTRLDLTGADSLTDIGAEAFIYDKIQDDLTLPATLEHIGDRAFFGNLIGTMTIPPDSVLETISDSAFAYNRIMGESNSSDLTFPDTLTSIGTLAFVGNLLTGVHADSSVSIGDHAFDYNNISELSLPSAQLNGASPANIENPAIYFAPNKRLISLGELFGDTDLAGLGLDHIDIDPGNVWSSTGVSYSSAGGGMFTVPAGTTSFRFAWNMAQDGKSVFNGYYQVYLNEDRIRVRDSFSDYQARWTPLDNFISARDAGGNAITVSSLDVILTDPMGVVRLTNSQGGSDTLEYNLSSEGLWHVQFRYPRGSTNPSSIADAYVNVTRHLKGKLSGSTTAVANGEVQKPEPAKYTLTMFESDGTTVHPGTFTLEPGDLQLMNADGTVQGDGASAVGTYQVRLTEQGKARIVNLLDANHLGTRWYDVDYSLGDATFIIKTIDFQLPLAGAIPIRAIIGTLLIGISLSGASILLVNRLLHHCDG